MIQAARWTAMLAIGAALGCGGQASGPPAARWGEEVCGRCGMIVSDARFAAALVQTGEPPVFFDEVAELVLALRDDPSPAKVPWVRDYQHDAWIPAPEAVYVASSAFSTPMGLGVVATAGQSAAEQLAAETGGTLWGWTGLRQRWQPAAGDGGRPRTPDDP